ncbi:MAG TPA: crossover junction endodeoxyribonuclease RuvC [Pyrinomonadaceae bacterium]|nr:crossover junction endodeoxyribonuclease RuvC [Pyrinomonadaceae bacterium]
MRVLGIDPGSETTGWGVVEGDSNGQRYRLVEFGTVKLSSAASFSSRLLTISRSLEEVIDRLRPDACAIEEAFYSVNPKVILKLGQVRGVALLAAERAALEIGEYSPRLVKQTVAGYGNAEKHQVQEMVRVLLSLREVPEPHDAADALAVAICHFHHAGVSRRLMAAEARTKTNPTVAAGARRRAIR